MREKLDNIELRSDEVKDILTRPPHSLIRYGTTVICLILLLFFVGSFFFRYPDIIQGDVIVTTENPPAWIVAKATGRIKELYITDKSSVNQGDLIAVIDNPAITTDVKRVKQLLIEKTQVSDSVVALEAELISVTYELGELQSAFSLFSKAAINYQNFESLNLTKQDELALKTQLAGRNSYAANLQKQLILKEQELSVAKSLYDRDKELYKKGVIAKSEFEATEQSYLNLQQMLRQLEGSIVTEQIENSKLKSSASKLSIEYLQDRNTKYQELATAYRELMAEIENWEQKYLLISPQAGTVTFNTVWSRNQVVNIGDKVFVIVPKDPGALIGKLDAPLSGSGKIKEGQLVNIKVSGYPYLEYGMLQGYVRNISLVSSGSYYTVEISLPNKLTSTTGVDFKFTGELRGGAEVVTKDRSLAFRILAPLRYLLKNNF
ncbi:HlyD family efflux transporter periplasmic adaptor subunit [Dysgonomonas sp. HDW5A]|uniref:HlyD family secretion protein n=1 Tax=Dysgonomonas sp. HDW5A TaxID=2714926 RepID=UPI00140C17B0|nr:HlyD family efflux transporter periplasmic adaptor subunit [Dysgonomonas sp. HDW5A]QIK60094.1 HlyD family efflux transporter periplasmic adaptor subunit [Dysgonomonas sp. HDW5A]